MTKIFVDDKEIEIKEGQNLLHAALSKGYDLPYFCWHPALGSVGACRQCAVIQYKDADDKKGRLVMSCMTPATEGIRISIDHPDAKSFRASVIEWLMTNHPHDCPVCDEGGECHLQDMTLMSGHNYRNFRFNKRTFKNQNLGPHINHEMNRCITCYRCVRYYRDVAGGTDLNAFASSNRVYFGRAEDGALESPFSGNLVEVCPTGVFTDKHFKEQYARKWDLQMAPSICQQCSLGCNITPGERGGILRRVQNRFHAEINGYFMCDKGRFGHDFVNSPSRIRKALHRAQASLPQTELLFSDALSLASQKIAGTTNRVGVGSERASLESNFALRSLVGADNFYASGSESDFACSARIHSVLASKQLHHPSLKEIEEADAVLILGEDLTTHAPMMAFSVRQILFHQAQKEAAKLKIPDWNDAAIRNLVREKKGPIFSLQLAPTRLDDIAHTEIVPNIDAIVAAAEAFASKHLAEAQRPVIIAGTSLGSLALIDVATKLTHKLKADGKAIGLAFVVPAANTMGLHVLGAKSPSALKERLQKGVDVAVALENDTTLEGASFVVALDHSNHLALSRADIVLPVATFAESTGSLVNNEGRVQRFYRVMSPEEPVTDAWRTLGLLNGSRASLDQLTEEMGNTVSVLSPFTTHVMKASFRLCGQKIPRESAEYSGRTAIVADKTMHEPKPPEDADSPYAHSLEGMSTTQASGHTAFFWAPQWNSVSSLNKFQEEVGGPLRDGPVGVRLFDAKAGEAS